MKEVSFRRDTIRIQIGEPTKKIFLVNPKEVLDQKKEDIVSRLRRTMGSSDVENFIVDHLFELSEKAEKEADLSDFSNLKVSFFLPPDYLERSRNPKNFLESFLRLPIFEIVEENDEKKVLQFVK